MSPSPETNLELEQEFRQLEERLVALREACTTLAGCKGEEERNKAALEGRLALVELRGVHRNILRGSKEQQDQAQEAILAADHAHRILHAAKYEKEFIQSKLDAAKEMLGHGFETDMGLLPLETFRTEAPQELQQNTDTPHKLLIARIKFEESRRKEAALQKNVELQKKHDQEKRVAVKRKMLETLHEEAKLLKRQTAPLWDKLALKRLPADSSVTHLPKPLHILHSRIKYYCAKHNLAVLLEVWKGSDRETLEHEVSEARKGDLGPSPDHPEGESMEIEADALTKSSGQAPEQDREPNVTLHILHADSKEKLLSIMFSFHQNINAVTARCLHPLGSTVLDDVLPAPGMMEEEEGTLQEYKVHRWVQYLAGLEANSIEDETEWFSTDSILQKLLQQATDAPQA